MPCWENRARILSCAAVSVTAEERLDVEETFCSSFNDSMDALLALEKLRINESSGYFEISLVCTFDLK